MRQPRLRSCILASHTPACKVVVQEQHHGRHELKKPSELVCDEVLNHLVADGWVCCAAHNCIHQFSKFEILEFRQQYAVLDEAGRTDFLVQQLRAHMDDRKEIHYELLTRPCCVAAFSWR